MISFTSGKRKIGDEVNEQEPKQIKTKDSRKVQSCSAYALWPSDVVLGDESTVVEDEKGINDRKISNADENEDEEDKEGPGNLTYGDKTL